MIGVDLAGFGGARRNMIQAAWTANGGCMARTDLDGLLGALKASSMDAALDGLEADVWTRVETARRTQAAGGGVRVQLAVAVAALLVGAVVGGVTAQRQPVRSEMVVLSADGGRAPSGAIEGGA
jgi:hypothetical protein